MTSAIGDTLLVLRRSRGMSQEELASAASITQAALSRYENNLREPDAEVRKRLAAILGVTPAFIEHHFSMRGGISADAHMRRRATAKVTDWKAAEARLNELRMHSTFLLERVPLQPQNQVPHLDPVVTTPEDAARQVRGEWSLPIGPIRNLTSWVESSGVLVISEPLTSKRIDGMSQWAGDHAVVLINSLFPPDRVRLTLAHELGHLVLHSAYQGADVEEQASAFAAELLMPAHLIKPQLRKLTLGRLLDLKREWQVSMQALIEQAWRLQTITKDERGTLYRQLSRQGWRTKEPGSDEMAPETPTLAPSIGQQLLDAGLSRAEILTMIGLRSGATTPLLPPETHGKVVSFSDWRR